MNRNFKDRNVKDRNLMNRNFKDRNFKDRKEPNIVSSSVSPPQSQCS